MFRSNIIRILLLSLLSLVPSLAIADNGQGNDLGLSVSDIVIRGDASQQKTTATISGKNGWTFSLAVNTSPQVWVEKNDSATLATGATILKTGTVGRDGTTSIQVALPSSDSGKIFLQAYASRKPNGGKDNQFSQTVTVISLADLLSGMAGVKGDKGDEGPMGPQGVAGPTGAQGPTGADGAMGLQGPQGLKGDKGDTGATGATGAQGAKGDTGETGAAGPQGLKGEKGDTGATGATGAQGAKGDTGETGAAGPQGLKGDKGDTGATGATGAQGAKGDKGDTGEAGPMGPVGATGAQGAPGITPELKCPDGWVDLGPTCLQPTFEQGTIEQAINSCYQKGARVCEHQDLAFVCSNRESLNVTFPDDTWFLTGTVILRSLNANSSFVAYTVYRRFGNRCYGPNTINPSDGVVSYELSNAARSYACCSSRTF